MRPLLPALLAAFAALAAPAFADAIEDGENVYKTKTCMACHGIKGARPVLSYPALAGQNEKYIIAQMNDIKAGKRVGTVDPDTGSPYVKGMADIMHLVDDKDIANVAKYLAQLPPGKPKAVDPAPDPAQLEAGAAAYKKLGCTSCHGKDGLKPTAKTYPFLAGLNRDYLTRAMTEMRDKVRVSGQSKLMFGTISKADDTQIADIAAWLSQIDRSAQ